MTIKIPLLDLKKQISPFRQELDAAIKQVIDSGNFILGREVQDLENEISQYCSVKYAVGVSNGTDAIRLALVASGVNRGDGVICPAFTYFATAGAIAGIGAIPVFADIDPLTYNITAIAIQEAMQQKANLPGGSFAVKAVIPVHLYGQCADMDSIMQVAKKYKLKVVEDNAQSFGAEYKGKKAGTIGDCGTVSFFPGKNLGAFGDAGMVLTEADAIADRLKILRNQGNKDKYYHLVLGYNNRMDAIQAAVLKIKLKHLDSWNKKRQENAQYFNQQFKDLNINTPFVPEYTTHIYHQYVLRLNASSSKLIEHLRGKGIDSRVYYPVPLHLQECFKYLAYKKGDFPESEKAAQQTLAIPVHPDLTREEMDYIIAQIKEFMG